MTRRVVRRTFGVLPGATSGPPQLREIQITGKVHLAKADQVYYPITLHHYPEHPYYSEALLRCSELANCTDMLGEAVVLAGRQNSYTNNLACHGIFHSLRVVHGRVIGPRCSR